MQRIGQVSPLFAIGLVWVAVGCQPTPGANAGSSGESPLLVSNVEMPPKELVDAVKQSVSAPPLSLEVEQHNKGTVVTGWKRYRGDWHIGRHWQERTRYRIEVSPDWDEPLARSRMLVIAETQQRAAEGQRWNREGQVARPRRAEAALQAILDHVGRHAAK